MRDNNILPTFHLGDGAGAITNAGTAVYSESCRLMCWSHVHSNILPQLKCVTAHNKALSDNILRDIVNLQWSALNEATFRKSFKLLKEKYLNKQEVVLNSS